MNGKPPACFRGFILLVKGSLVQRKWVEVGVLALFLEDVCAAATSNLLIRDVWG